MSDNKGVKDVKVLKGETEKDIGIVYAGTSNKSSSGSAEIIIRDVNKQLLEGIKVILKPKNGGKEYSSVSNEYGKVYFKKLPKGDYIIETIKE